MTHSSLLAYQSIRILSRHCVTAALDSRCTRPLYSAYLLTVPVPFERSKVGLLSAASTSPESSLSISLGSYDFAHNICYIVDAIDSPSDSKEYPDAYIRGSNGLYEKVCKIENITIGNLTYIGEWHSHPADSTFPSADDMKLLQSIADYTFSQSSPGCMMIVGENHYSIYLKSI